MYQCTTCSEILEPHECITTHSEELCEVYVNCPICRGECVDYNEDNDYIEDEEEEEYAEETC